MTQSPDNPHHMQPLIVLAEDDHGLRLTLSDRLTAEGYRVVAVHTGSAVHTAITENAADLLILDVMLPDRSGLDVCKALRDLGEDIPVLMLTALQAVEDRIAGLKHGADDYLYKPFDVAELLARIEALLRRSPPRATRMQLGVATIELEANSIMRDGVAVELSARAFDLLRYLITHAGKTHTREHLLHRVWGHQNSVDTRTVDVHIGWLRKAIEADHTQPRHIRTVHRVGYRLDLHPTH